jgi:bacterial/archaeal transporter family-2 protein
LQSAGANVARTRRGHFRDVTDDAIFFPKLLSNDAPRTPGEKEKMLNLLIPSTLAVIAGVSVVIQQVLNANLRSELDSAVWSGFMSYFVGVISMLVLAAVLRVPIPSTVIIARIPWWAWCGGLFGVVFICISILVAKQLGAATLIALLVTGQMLASIVIDHFGWLGLQQKPIDAGRLVAVALLIGGVVLIRR